MTTLVSLAAVTRSADMSAGRADALGHTLGLGLVALAMLVSPIVFTEPAPVDLVMLAAMAVLPLVGLIRITRGLAAFAALCMIPVACAFLGVLQATDIKSATLHTAVTLFLVAGSLMLSAFIMAAPMRHTRLIFNSYTFAALIAAILGIAGYFGLFPGAGDLFTRFGRATGTFKDPNVFGPFLVAPIVYLMSRMLDRETRYKPLLALVAGVLALAVLLSVSRGAWFCLAVAILVFAGLSYLTAPTAHARARIVLAMGAALAGVIVIVAVALQFDAVSDLLSQRASLTQSYDEGPEGRFGGQQKAKALIFAHPLGLGAQQFGAFFHVEEAHNVYLSMFLNAGWIGGLVFIVIICATVIFGLPHALKRTSTQPMFLAAYAAFLGHALEGFVIDLDHWRHLHVLIAIVWGLMLWSGVPSPRPTRRRVHIAS